MSLHAQDHDPNCLFCKIVSGKIPSRPIYSDDHCVVFLDINPVNHGHLLIVPKIHHSDITELPHEVASWIGSLLPRFSRALLKSRCADGVNIIIKNGSAAGQTIIHGHWHIIPRFHNDTVNWPWPHGQYNGDEINQVALAIEMELNKS